MVLISGDGHHAWINSEGLSVLGLPQREGMVEEYEWFETYPRLTGLLGPSLAGSDAYQRMFESASAQGVVGLVDLEFEEACLRPGRRGRPPARSASGSGSAPTPGPSTPTSASG